MMKPQSVANFKKGLLSENPVLVMMLGMCPTLGVTTSAVNGLGMGLATMFVLLLSNMAIAAVARFIPDTVRIPCYIVIIAAIVSFLEMLMQAYVPFLYQALGIYIPLIVVNCLILGRAEAFAAKNNVTQSFFDALGMGLGFALALLILGSLREILGNFSIFGISFAEGGYPLLLFIMPPGAFLALALLIIITKRLKGEK